MKTFQDYGISVTTTTGQTKTTCPRCSPSRKKSKTPCLSVNTDQGTWNCWHCDQSGTLISGWSGEYTQSYVPKKIWVKPFYGFKELDLPDRAKTWFKDRGINEKTLIHNKISYGKIYMPQVEAEVNTIQFPFSRQGQTINIKYRDGNKNFRLSSGAERIFFGLDNLNLVKGEKNVIIITEGEMDKLSCDEAQIQNAISVPDGAPSVNTKNFDKKFDYLVSAKSIFDQADKVILAVDADEPGQKLEEELSRRIGREKCCRVKYPTDCKDCNDVLLKFGAEQLREIIDNAIPYPVAGIFEFKDIADKIEQLYNAGSQRGESTGWSNLDKLYSVRLSEWTVVTGQPSSGKGELIDSLILNLAKTCGWKFGIYSPENQPLERHAAKLIEKCEGLPFKEGDTPRISREHLRDTIGLLQEYCYFILPGYEDSHSIDSILNLARVLVFRKGIKGLVIDPWNEIDHSREPGLTETEHISKCLSKIRKFARVYGVHIWIVAHPTKLQKDQEGNYPVPTPYDISGSSHWRNKADNCISVWRDMHEPGSPTQIHVQKIRFKEVGKIGMIELDYDFLTGRFSDHLEVVL